MDKSAQDMLATLNNWVDIQSKNNAHHALKSTALAQEAPARRYKDMRDYDAQNRAVWSKERPDHITEQNGEPQSHRSGELEAANDNPLEADKAAVGNVR